MGKMENKVTVRVEAFVHRNIGDDFDFQVLRILPQDWVDVELLEHILTPLDEIERGFDLDRIKECIGNESNVCVELELLYCYDDGWYIEKIENKKTLPNVSLERENPGDLPDLNLYNLLYRWEFPWGKGEETFPPPTEPNCIEKGETMKIKKIREKTFTLFQVQDNMGGISLSYYRDDSGD